MTKKKNLLVGVDDGYAQIKLYGESDRGPVKLKMRSSARAGRDGLGSISGTGGVGSYETPEGDIYTVSEDVEGESTRFDGFHTSTLNRVLVNHALMKTGYSGKSVTLMTGLPVADFFLEEMKDEDQIAKKRDNLLKEVVPTSSYNIMAKVEEVDVGCQAVAAWFDWVLNDELEEIHDPDGSVAVVDIGGRTTDIAVVVSGRDIDHAHSGTENVGVLDVYETLAKGLRQRFRLRERFPINHLDQAVRTGRIELWGEESDIRDLVRDAKMEAEGKLAREIQRKIGMAATLKAVLFVGGGANLFNAISKHFRNGHIIEDPEFANARGLYKYSKYHS